jgi:tetratricopeptide (TPR) repeat protein
MEEKTKELFQKVVALDPEGKAGSYYNESLKARIPYAEAAEFELGQIASFGRKPDPAPLKAFIAKYPESKLVKQAYSYLSSYYGYQASKEDAAKFFEEYAARFPEDKNALGAYIQRIIRDKEPLDKGIALAEKLKEITGYPRNPEVQQNLAQLHILKGDEAKGDEEFGKDFIDGYVSSTVRALTGYAGFWIGQKKNLDSVEAMADLAAKIKPDQWYTLSQVAGIYARLDKPDKALALFGPEFARKNWNDGDILASYAGFWNRQGSNLDDAAAAAKRSVELAPDYSNYNILGQLLLKQKKYGEALKAAEKAVELVKPMAAKYEGFPVQPYEKLVKDIKDAMAKEKAGEARK